MIKTYITTYCSELVFMFITELVNKFFAAIYENGHTNRDPIFEKNETNSTRKKMVTNLILVKKIIMHIMKLAEY